MAKRLYIGSLPYETTEDDLREMFGKAGTVETAQVIVDKFSGRSKGFGFVQMPDDAEADKAVEMFNGSQIGTRKIIVNEARPMGERPPRRDFSARRF